MALLLAQARNIPQAHAALVQGRWERSRWDGRRAGRQDPRRHRPRPHRQAGGPAGHGLRHAHRGPRPVRVARDGPQDEHRARRPRRRSWPSADFVTIHVAKTPETVGLIDADRLAKAKQGLRIINVARGGIVDEDDLADAIDERARRRCRPRRVRRPSPPPSRRCSPCRQVVVTPHLGASTHEAQDKAGDTIAEQVESGPGRRVRALRGQRRRRRGQRDGPAVPRRWPSGSARCSPGWPAGCPTRSRSSYEGEIGGYDTRILTLSVLKGLFGRVSDEPVSYVNAPQSGRGARHRRHRVVHHHLAPTTST